MRKKKKSLEEQHGDDFAVLVALSVIMTLVTITLTINTMRLGWGQLRLYGVPALIILINTIVLYLGYRYLPNSTIGRYIRYKQKKKAEQQPDNIN